MSVAGATGFLRYAEPAAQVVLLGCLYRRNLWRRYSRFAALLLAQVIRALVLIRFDFHSPAYARVWALTQPIIWVLEMMAIIELISASLEYRPKLEARVSALLAWCTAGAAVVSGVLAALELPGTRDNLWWWWLWEAYTANKYMALFMFFALAVQIVCFTIFSIPTRRNVLLHRWLLTCYCGFFPAVAMFLVMVSGIAGNWANLGLLSAEIFCVVLWIWQMQPAGEVPPEAPVLEMRSGLRAATGPR